MDSHQCSSSLTLHQHHLCLRLAHTCPRRARIRRAGDSVRAAILGGLLTLEGRRFRLRPRGVARPRASAECQHDAYRRGGEAGHPAGTLEEPPHSSPSPPWLLSHHLSHHLSEIILSPPLGTSNPLAQPLSEIAISPPWQTLPHLLSEITFSSATKTSHPLHHTFSEMPHG